MLGSFEGLSHDTESRQSKAGVDFTFERGSISETQDESDHAWITALRRRSREKSRSGLCGDARMNWR